MIEIMSKADIRRESGISGSGLNYLVKRLLSEELQPEYKSGSKVFWSKDRGEILISKIKEQKILPPYIKRYY